ncbi:ATPase [uncultured Litoreibacter sp.]|uniref:ATPase n=1 Tax=uncultured Litoreibacter sp. TaxID=1392394 RepID=UPI00263421B6|nr:ATPase [uncultured Litoreibacter sp.]
MRYNSGKDWLNAKSKRVLFFGMSGLGKTHVSNMLRASGQWFHYSADYRIGTRYMGEYITDNFKRRAMQDPFLAELLRSDSIYIASNLTFDDLSPLSTYLGKPGDPAKGGLSFDEYQKRQAQHHRAEVAALYDTAHFIDRAKDLYGYDNFVCDSGGSTCEVVDPFDKDDALLSALAEDHLMVWIEGSKEHEAELVRRFKRAPKPMCYRPEFLSNIWDEYLNKNKVKEGDVDPNDFVTFTYARAISQREPRYRAMFENFGVKVSHTDLAKCTTPDGLDQLIAHTLGND